VIELTLRHELRCTPERHWKLFFDPDWTKELILDGLAFNKCEVGDLERSGDITTRMMRVEPKIDVPGPVARLLGPKLGYTEKGTFNETTKAWNYALVLSVLSEKILLGGDVTVEPKGDDKCVRLSKIWMKAKIPIIGGLVEKAAEKNMKKGWDDSAAWINGWLDAHPESDAAR
jgi:hypothetical protein